MRLAILYTGELRTIEKVIPYFKENVLNCSSSELEIDVFATWQCNHKPDEPKYEDLIRQYMGEHLKSLKWFEKNNHIWINMRETLLDNMNISNRASRPI